MGICEVYGTVLERDLFRVAAVADYLGVFTDTAVAVDGKIAAIRFTPPAPDGGFPDRAAIVTAAGMDVE